MSTLRNAVSRLHRDEEGMEAMQAVIIVGVAAVILALIYNYKGTLMSKVKNLINTVLT